MFFVLSKILAAFTMPFTWLLGLLLAAYLVKNKGHRKKLLWTCLGVFIFFSNQTIFDESMRLWEVDGVNHQEIPEHDVAIVLGGMAAFNSELDRLSFGRGSDRIWQAVRLYKNGKVKKILICGDSGTMTDYGLDEARQLKDYLLEIGLPEEDIWIETESVNTHENAEFGARILNKHPEYSSYLLVTSASHMRRSLACFRKEGVDCTPFSVDHYTGDRWFSFERLFIPSISTLQNWNTLTHELTGYLMYRIMGYI